MYIKHGKINKKFILLANVFILTVFSIKENIVAHTHKGKELKPSQRDSLDRNTYRI